jgi:hypothetical protein
MSFLSRIMGSIPTGSRVRKELRSAGRRCSRLELGRLESRDLMSGIAGVSLTYGNLTIESPKTSGNTAIVSIDPSTKNVEVTLNGQSEEFSPSLVDNITYVGGAGGGDTFTDNTSLVSLDYGYGSGNTFTGGSSYNYVFFYGGDNTFNGVKGSVSDVFEDGYTNDLINADGGIVQQYSS